MKLLMLIVDAARKEQLEVVLSRAGVAGYTEIPNAVGSGTTGPRLGSAAFPRTSAVVLTFVEDEKVPALAADLKTYCSDCGERARVVAWGVEQVL